MEKLSRRNFLKLSAAGAGGGSLLVAAGLGLSRRTSGQALPAVRLEFRDRRVAVSHVG
jgi:anaerobic selenocysteine-containing dehydrogenase